VENPKLDYKYLKKEAGKVEQDRVVFGRQKVLTDIFKY
jgi:hypothetical protein